MSINQELFGSTKKKEAKGGHKIDSSMLNKQFEGSESVAYVFCEACGIYLEANQEISKKYLALLERGDSEIDPNTYFLASSCEVCSNDNKITDLKSI